MLVVLLLVSMQSICPGALCAKLARAVRCVVPAAGPTRRSNQAIAEAIARRRSIPLPAGQHPRKPATVTGCQCHLGPQPAVEAMANHDAICRRLQQRQLVIAPRDRRIRSQRVARAKQQQARNNG